jgi:hypothetical protein
MEIRESGVYKKWIKNLRDSGPDTVSTPGLSGSNRETPAM